MSPAVLGPSLVHQQASTSPKFQGPGPANYWASTSPRTPQHLQPATLGPSPAHQRDGDIPRTPRHQSQLLWIPHTPQPAMLGSGLTHQQASSSPRPHSQLPWDLALTTSRLTPNPGFIRPCRQPCQDTASPTSGQQSLHEANLDSQPGWGPAISKSVLTIYSPITTESPTQSTEWAPLDHIALVSRRECAAGPHRISPK